MNRSAILKFSRWLSLFLLYIITSSGAFLFLTYRMGYAQQLSQSYRLTGTITDATTGETLPGVNIKIEGTQKGTTTNRRGIYHLSVSGSDTLLFSYIGYQSQSIPVNGKQVINVSLSQTTSQLNQVVVTALGQKSQKRSLGYSVQEINSKNLTTTTQPNMVSLLNGKIAGVSVTSANDGVGGSAYINIRGWSSLTGNNQPLFVVDGIPISNQTSTNFSVDYGNGAAEIDPNDIKSISVLKGPNAAALYGSRAANGVILITTKDGKGRKGIGVSLHSSLYFQTPLTLPNYQNQYGAGLAPDYHFTNGYDDSDQNWGSPLDSAGLKLPQFDSPTTNGYRGGDNIPNKGTIIPTPWISHPNNVRSFFNTGDMLTNSLAISGGSSKGNYRFSYTNLNQRGMVPNTNLLRNNVNLNGSYHITDRFDVSTNINFIKSNSKNLPSKSYGSHTIMYTFIWMGRQVNMNSLKNYWQAQQTGLQEYNYNDAYENNPYFIVYQNLNGLDKNRLIGNVDLTYNFTDWFNMKFSTGLDYYEELNSARRAFSTQDYPYGAYAEYHTHFQERNTSLLATFNRPIFPNVNAKISVGGNLMSRNQRNLNTTAPELSIPELYNFGNSRVSLSVNQYDASKKINSVYGLANLSYHDYLYLNLTARNDWSSTLPKNNNSYFYPSVSISAIPSSMAFWHLIPISFFKLRASIAQVGNDTSPYRLTQNYNYQQPWGNTQTIDESSVVANANLKPEMTTSYEFGAELQFFENRLGINATYYNETSKNQILNIPVDITSGYSAVSINGGKVRNYGVELSLHAVPVSLSHNFSWNVDVNWSHNQSRVLSLPAGITSYQMASSHSVSLLARVGGRMGDIYGKGFQRSPSGQIIYKNGLPQETNDVMLLGNINPNWIGSIQNTITYKNVSASFLFNLHYGGKVYSYTAAVGGESGALKETLPGRQNGIVGNGVVANGDGTYSKNTVRVSAHDYYNTYYGRGNIEAALYDGTYLKLQEVNLSYHLPQSLLRRTPIQTASLSLVGRNLLLWTQNPSFDPETFSFSGSRPLPGIETMELPSARSFGLELSLSL